jgi:hypothetical protein
MASSGQARWPQHVATQCPHCGFATLFDWKSNQTNFHAGISSGTSTCANCKGNVRLLAVFEVVNKQFSSSPAEIRMFPSPKASFEVPAFPAGVPDVLAKSMEDTVRAFNSQIYGACATSGRRTLEGIFKYMVAEESRGKNLYELIRAAEKEIDFKEPLRRLADAIRNGGNLGAHFDEEREPDVEMARQMLELLTYLIEYLYVLPDQIKKLEDTIIALPSIVKKTE